MSVMAEETAPANRAVHRLERFGGRGIRVHDPSTIVKCGAEYWLFSTGVGILSRHSKDLITWEEGPRVFTNYPAWTSQVATGFKGHIWAPDIIRLNGRYYLYYSVSRWGTNTSAIGLATTATLNPADPDYGWTDQGMVIQSRSQDPYNCIDPAVTLDENGGLWMSFGSFWSGIKLVQLDPATGQRLSPDSPIYSLAYQSAIEAPCIAHHDDFYYMFVNWGFCCRGTNSTYNIRVGRSISITGPYRDKNGVDMMERGGSPFLESSGSFIGPGHAGIFTHNGTNWLSGHFYDGTRRGLSTLMVLPVIWETNGWPKAVFSLE